MTAMVVLAVIFSLSIIYYIKAKNLAPYLYKISALEAEVAKQEAIMESLRSEVVHAQILIQQGKEAEEWLKKHKEEIENLKQLLISKRIEFNRIMNEMDSQISERQKTLTDLEKKVTNVENEIEKIRQEKAVLEGKADEAQRIISRLEMIREDSNDKWKNLDAPVVDENAMRKPNDATYLDENIWLQNFEQSLKKHDFIFHERTIRAFHTGLKCSRQTQLVVLAGISGTGKSLLPELYAAALGMNFLSVPVQPRWDSPQDLFGFYIYADRRFKATELSRLLWQFDLYNGPAKERYGSQKDSLPLNLVLLDEMNLARVEYYFADLLSKLETRNGLNPDNETERRKAEIELECNAADKLETMRRLFVSPYTLFTGTMNEDESTQTLSDKVIDRSNVLRFGRPQMIGQGGQDNESQHRKPSKSDFIASYADKSRISAKVWDIWCKPLDKADDTDEGLAFLKKTVSPIARELDKVYRSFGFRMDDAMKLYVMNYPGSFKEAVADQIEMKILPRLNGIELQDAHFNSVKNTISGAIDSTGDEGLRKAFDEAVNPENGIFFKWRGVMR